MEYLAMGKPVLLTDMNAHRAVIPNEDDAFYVPRCTSEDFAEGIRRAYSQQDRFALIGSRGRAKAETELTWEHQARILRDYLQDVMESKIKLQGSRS
jgi:glycosyltransferase involved in cell wall biosynthesis